jgi:hypothetical protein
LTIWHGRFGHLGEQNFKLLLHKNLVIGMRAKIDCQFDFCIVCVIGKQCKNPFQEGDLQNFTTLPWN